MADDDNFKKLLADSGGTLKDPAVAITSNTLPQTLGTPIAITPLEATKDMSVGTPALAALLKAVTATTKKD